MRRSGSSSCLLRPRKSLTPLELEQEKPGITMISTKRLPTYSVERYYMLSEIEEHSQSILFLEDFEEHRDRENDNDSSDNVIARIVPSHVILYVLWEPMTTHSPRAFVDSEIVPALERLLWKAEGYRLQNNSNNDSSPSSSPTHLQQPHKQQKNMPPPAPKTKVYLVVEKLSPLVPEWHCNEESTNDEHNAASFSREAHHAVEIKVAEDLATYVAQSKLTRPLLQGMTVGITSQSRAAPALETILSTTTFGSSHRRAYRRHRRNPSKDSNTLNLLKSIIGVCTPSTDHLTGTDEERSTDAVENVLQSVTHAEWGGNGDHLLFARRAQDEWTRLYGLVSHPLVTDATTGKKGKAAGTKVMRDDQESFFLVYLFWLCLGLFLWLRYAHCMLDWWDGFCNISLVYWEKQCERGADVKSWIAKHYLGALSKHITHCTNEFDSLIVSFFTRLWNSGLEEWWQEGKRYMYTFLLR